MAAQEDYCVLDGGFATELMRTHGFQINGDPLWSARLIKTNDDVIKKVHCSYIEAGADLIETATYQASIAGFITHLGVSRDEATELMRKAVDICKSAVDEFWQVSENRCGRIKPLVVGSLGPYGAHLADLSEYTGNYVDDLSIEDIINWHRPQLQVLTESGVDIVAFETIPAQKEAEALVQLLREFPSAKAWLSFSCKDGKHTCHGERLSVAASAAAACDQVVAVGINCTQPTCISDLLSDIPNDIKSTKSLVVYPNGVEDSPASRLQQDTNSAVGFNKYVADWVKLGAKWIGGCCNVTPAEIAVIRKALLNPKV